MATPTPTPRPPVMGLDPGGPKKPPDFTLGGIRYTMEPDDQNPGGWRAVPVAGQRFPAADTGPKERVDQSAQQGINPETGQPEWFTIRPDGSVQWSGAGIPGVNPHPGTTVSVSARDPQQIAIDTARLQLDEARYQAEIADKIQARAQAQQLFEFNKSKEEYARSVNDKKMVLEAQQQAFAQQQVIANYNLQITQIQGARQQAQMQMQQRTDEFNATQAFNTQRANEEAGVRRQQQMQSLAKDIGTLAADPGDRGAYASTILANSGWGQANRATQGDFRTADSLAPLESMLRQREQLQQQPVAPYTFNPIQSPQLPALTMPSAPAAPSGAIPTAPAGATDPNRPPGIPDWVPTPAGGWAPLDGSPSNQRAGAIPTAPAAPAPMQVTAGMTKGPYQIPYSAAPFTLGAVNTLIEDAKRGGNTWSTHNFGDQRQFDDFLGAYRQNTGSDLTLNPSDVAYLRGNLPFALNVPKAETGGFLRGAYISGERGPELNIPTGDGRTLVLNQKQAKHHGLDIKSMMKGGKQKKMASGGVFDGLGLDSNRTLATDFLKDASARARAGTPFDTGALPTAVFASSPGFNPVVAQLLASLRANGLGQPANDFLRMATMYRPQGVGENVVRRSA